MASPVSEAGPKAISKSKRRQKLSRRPPARFGRGCAAIIGPRGFPNTMAGRPAHVSRPLTGSRPRPRGRCRPPPRIANASVDGIFALRAHDLGTRLWQRRPSRSGGARPGIVHIEACVSAGFRACGRGPDVPWNTFARSSPPRRRTRGRPARRRRQGPARGCRGRTVRPAASGDEARRIFSDGRGFDPPPADIVTPGPLQAPGLARKSRLLHGDRPVVFMSGHAEGAAMHGNG